MMMTMMTIMILDTIANVALANKITKREKAAFSKSVNCTSNGRNSTRHPGPSRISISVSSSRDDSI